MNLFYFFDWSPFLLDLPEATGGVASVERASHPQFTLVPVSTMADPTNPALVDKTLVSQQSLNLGEDTPVTDKLTDINGFVVTQSTDELVGTRLRSISTLSKASQASKVGFNLKRTTQFGQDSS